MLKAEDGWRSGRQMVGAGQGCAVDPCAQKDETFHKKFERSHHCLSIEDSQSSCHFITARRLMYKVGTISDTRPACRNKWDSIRVSWWNSLLQSPTYYFYRWADTQKPNQSLMSNVMFVDTSQPSSMRSPCFFSVISPCNLRGFIPRYITAILLLQL